MSVVDLFLKRPLACADFVLLDDQILFIVCMWAEGFAPYGAKAPADDLQALLDMGASRARVVRERIRSAPPKEFGPELYLKYV